MIYGGAAAKTVNLGDLSPDQGFLLQGDAAGDLTGWSIDSAGDVNGDGFDDLIIGAPYGSRGADYAGQAYLIFGGAGLSDIDLTSLADSGIDHRGRSDRRICRVQRLCCRRYQWRWLRGSPGWLADRQRHGR